MGTREVRVATLNLWGRHGDWEGRRPILAEGLREIRPDVVAFQEAVVADGYDQAADLLGAEYHVVHHGDRMEDGSGVSIASGWRKGGTPTTWCWPAPSTPPPALRACVSGPGGSPWEA